MPIITATHATDAACAGVANGGARVIINGGAGVPYTVIWSKGNPLGVGDSVFGLDAGVVYCTVTDGNGCAVLDSVTVRSGAPTPPVVISYHGTRFCQGDSADIGSNWTFPSYHWNTGDTAQFFFTTTPGDYSVTVIDDNGCTLTSDTLHMSLAIPYLNPVITLSGDTLHSSVPDVWWYYNDTAQVTGPSSFLYPVQDGIYRVEATDTNGCVTQAFDTVTLAGIAAAGVGEQHLQVYPNPVEDVLYIDMPNTISDIMLIDAAGKVVTAFINPAHIHLNIPMKQLPAGSYWLTYVESGVQKAIKVIKAR